MNLSAHFTLDELTQSQSAARQNINNTPSPDIITNLKTLTSYLERVRKTLGRPIQISSGYRSPAVNKVIGGALNSSHIYGYAADFTSPGFGSPLEVCKAIQKSGIEFDQLIYEYRWVHFSCDPRMRKQILTKQSFGYREGLWSQF